MTPHKLLLDVGGTFIKCSDGREIAIDSAGSREEIVSSLREAVGGAEEVAVAIPGPFDYENGVFLMKHKFAAVYGEKFTDLLEHPVKKVSFEHDVIVMLRGEIASGNGKGYGRVALVTLGTGLGFALSIDGKILRNATGSPLVPIYNLPFRDGILEDYAAKRGFLRGYEGITVKELADRAKSGDEAAAARFREIGVIIGETISPILKEYDIDCLLFGGQISRSFGLFGPEIQKAVPGCVRFTGPISDFDNATFNGLSVVL